MVKIPTIIVTTNTVGSEGDRQVMLSLVQYSLMYGSEKQRYPQIKRLYILSRTDYMILRQILDILYLMGFF